MSHFHGNREAYAHNYRVFVLAHRRSSTVNCTKQAHRRGNCIEPIWMSHDFSPCGAALLPSESTCSARCTAGGCALIA